MEKTWQTKCKVCYTGHDVGEVQCRLCATPLHEEKSCKHCPLSAKTPGEFCTPCLEGFERGDISCFNYPCKNFRRLDQTFCVLCSLHVAEFPNSKK